MYCTSEISEGGMRDSSKYFEASSRRKTKLSGKFEAQAVVCIDLSNSH
jgi:hypothetical protein